MASSLATLGYAVLGLLWEVFCIMLPLMPPNSGPNLTLDKAPTLILLVLLSLTGSGMVGPALMTLAGRRASTTNGVMTLILAPALGYGLYGTTIVATTMALGLWERPYRLMAMFLLVIGYMIVALTCGMYSVMYLLRTGKTEVLLVGGLGQGEARPPTKEDDANFDKRAFIRSSVLSLFFALSFFGLAFNFLTLFFAARESVALQILALLIYQFVAHIVFKKLITSFTLKTLSNEIRLVAHPALAGIFEAIAELFLAFSFPAAKNPAVLVFAVVMETLLFCSMLRKLHLGWARLEGRLLGKGQQGIIMPEDLVDMGEADERTAYEVGGLKLVLHRRVVSFGVLFLFEWGAMIAFGVSYAAMCFGGNARYFNFGSNADGTCTAGEYLAPVLGSFATALIHLGIFLPARKYLLRVYKLDPWELALAWACRTCAMVVLVMPLTVGEIVTLWIEHYDLAGFSADMLK